ncbi:hypothetical protein T261_3748 [Streptomyces lydicus]|nr:hypothetical protein T261_3748 [Streptomyces lydicus]
MEGSFPWCAEDPYGVMCSSRCEVLIVNPANVIDGVQHVTRQMGYLALQ